MEFFMYMYDNTLCIPQAGALHHGGELPAFQQVDVSEEKAATLEAPVCVKRGGDVPVGEVPADEVYTSGTTSVFLHSFSLFVLSVSTMLMMR